MMGRLSFANSDGIFVKIKEGASPITFERTCNILIKLLTYFIFEKVGTFYNSIQLDSKCPFSIKLTELHPFVHISRILDFLRN